MEKIFCSHCGNKTAEKKPDHAKTYKDFSKVVEQLAKVIELGKNINNSNHDQDENIEKIPAFSYVLSRVKGLYAGTQKVAPILHAIAGGEGATVEQKARLAQTFKVEEAYLKEIKSREKELRKILKGDEAEKFLNLLIKTTESFIEMFEK